MREEALVELDGNQEREEELVHQIEMLRQKTEKQTMLIRQLTQITGAYPPLQRE